MKTTTLAGLTISPVPIPAALDTAEARLFLELVRLGNVSARHETGHPYLDQDATETLGMWRDGTDWTHRGFVAERDNQALGVSILRLANEPGAVIAEIDLFMDPAHWDGVADAVFEAAIDAARTHGRSTLQAWTLHSAATPGERIDSPTGYGSVPADEPQTRLMLRHGFALAQVERTSIFDLHGPTDTLTHTLAAALATAGDDYRLREWVGGTPEEHIESYARVLSRLHTDAPSGDLASDEHHWDAERVRRRDARLQAQGLLVAVSTVEHVPTGEIVAYNELSVAGDGTAATQQLGTLVLTEHRGHRLGTVVKCANLLRWPSLAPHSPCVCTFNAEENRPMLDINEALGFAPASYAAGWQRQLA